MIKMDKKGRRRGGGFFFLILILAAGYYFFFYQDGSHNPFNKISSCATEFQHITVGTASSDGTCCSGLTAKAPEGFAGGAWCVSSDYDIVCANYNKILGIYVVDVTNPDNHLLLNSMNCDIDGGVAQ